MSPLPSPALQRARQLPKVLLHEHLDGGLRLATLLELLHKRGLPSPADDVAALGAWFQARAHAGSLVEYLRGFGLTVAAMASPEAMRRVARQQRLQAEDQQRYRQQRRQQAEQALDEVGQGFIRAPAPSR